MKIGINHVRPHFGRIAHGAGLLEQAEAVCTALADAEGEALAEGIANLEHATRVLRDAVRALEIGLNAQRARFLEGGVS